jgi:hypothetical protein
MLLCEHMCRLHCALHWTILCRGYQRLGANVTRYDDTFQRDWHEALDLYYELDPGTHEVRRHGRLVAVRGLDL